MNEFSSCDLTCRLRTQRHPYRSFATRRRARSFLKSYTVPPTIPVFGKKGDTAASSLMASRKNVSILTQFYPEMNNKFNTWPFSGSFANLGRAIDLLACEQQTYFRSSLLSLRQPEMRLLFSGYRPPFVFRMWVIWCSQGNSPFVVLKVIRTYAREYNEIWKKQLASDPVQTYPDIFESATFSFRIQKCPRPHVSVFESPVHSYPDSL